jgi:hypothetical protein
VMKALGSPVPAAKSETEQVNGSRQISTEPGLKSAAAARPRPGSIKKRGRVFEIEILPFRPCPNLQ